MEIEIKPELIQERTETFWSHGNQVAIKFGREDLVLNEVERAVQAYVDLLEVKMLDIFEEGLSLEAVASLQSTVDHIKTTHPFFASGKRKMTKLVEEVLKHA